MGCGSRDYKVAQVALGEGTPPPQKGVYILLLWMGVDTGRSPRFLQF